MTDKIKQNSDEAKVKTLNVLVVDDELNMCIACQKSLRHFQVNIDSLNITSRYEIDRATSGQEFYEKYSQKEYNLVLLDYKLPDASGLDLLTHIISKDRDFPPLVIMITAYATFETAVSATKLGAYDFLAKPFTPDELRSSIKKATIRFALEEHARDFEEEKKKVKFQFLSVLAHELKAPLNAVEGYLKILNTKRENLPPEDFKHITERAMIRSLGMRKLIFDLLDLTRIESGEKKRNLQEENISQVLNNSVQNFEIEVSEKEIDLKTDIQEGVLLNADGSEFEIIFNNLISNSIKYNNQGGKVEVTLKMINENKNIQIEISDNGIGISEEDQKRLFTDFVRIKNEKTIHIEGSGLGLSTVKKIVDLYEGTIELTSAPDQGSKFKIIIPIH